MPPLHQFSLSIKTLLIFSSLVKQTIYMSLECAHVSALQNEWSIAVQLDEISRIEFLNRSMDRLYQYFPVTRLCVCVCMESFQNYAESSTSPPLQNEWSIAVQLDEISRIEFLNRNMDRLYQYFPVTRLCVCVCMESVQNYAESSTSPPLQNEWSLAI